MTNMARQGIASGFGFLFSVAGFDITPQLIEFGPDSTYARALLVAVLNTLFVSAVGIVLATVLGFMLGIARLSSNWLLSRLAGAYVEFARNIPLLLFVFIWYYGVLRALPAPRNGLKLLDAVFLNNRGLIVPRALDAADFWAAPAAFVIGLLLLAGLRAWLRRDPRRPPIPPLTLTVALLAGLPLLAVAVAAWRTGWERPVLQGFNVRGGITLIPEFVALALALATYTSAFIGEIVRSGILAVSEGQREAARALGLSPGQTLRLVVLPQALRVIIPPLTNQYLNIIKNSSFGAVIAFPELASVFIEKALTLTGQAVEIIAITLGIYLAINVSVSLLMNWYNYRTRLITR
jgi:general L-amino acid transport system permease protein